VFSNPFLSERLGGRVGGVPRGWIAQRAAGNLTIQGVCIDVHPRPDRLFGVQLCVVAGYRLGPLSLGVVLLEAMDEGGADVAIGVDPERHP
jgi:hypothetical protein